MAGQFAGKVALVTGAGSGIGRATALAFAREGAAVVVADIAEEGGHATVDLIRDGGGDAKFLRCDVTRVEEVAALVQGVIDTFGRLDFAHNNAGIEGPTVNMLNYPDDDFDRVMAVNVKGVWLCMKAELPRMLQQGAGVIVNTASVAGLRGAGIIAAYSASKHAVVGLTKSAAQAYSRRGVRINCVCPGVIRTPMFERGVALGGQQMEATSIAVHPIGRIGEPQEVAAAVVWLCSDAASFVTGAALPVDGAYTA